MGHSFDEFAVGGFLCTPNYRHPGLSHHRYIHHIDHTPSNHNILILFTTHLGSPGSAFL